MWFVWQRRTVQAFETKIKIKGAETKQEVWYSSLKICMPLPPPHTHQTPHPAPCCQEDWVSGPWRGESEGLLVHELRVMVESLALGWGEAERDPPAQDSLTVQAPEGLSLRNGSPVTTPGICSPPRPPQGSSARGHWGVFFLFPISLQGQLPWPAPRSSEHRISRGP